MGELWKGIRGYEGLYEVSSKGRIRSLDRIVYQGEKPRHIKGRLIKGWNNGSGYFVVSLCKLGQRKVHYIHRLVADHFLENPHNMPEVNHIDYDKSNNNLDNLEWVSRLDNIKHSVIHMYKPHQSSTNTGCSYITKRKNTNKYRVIVDKKENSADTIEEAIMIRDEMIKRRKR